MTGNDNVNFCEGGDGWWKGWVALLCLFGVPALVALWPPLGYLVFAGFVITIAGLLWKVLD